MGFTGEPFIESSDADAEKRESDNGLKTASISNCDIECPLNLETLQQLRAIRSSSPYFRPFFNYCNAR